MLEVTLTFSNKLLLLKGTGMEACGARVAIGIFIFSSSRVRDQKGAVRARPL